MSGERTTDVGSLLRELAPQVLTTLVRRYGDFDSCEDAVQEALLAAAGLGSAGGWPVEGVPDNPQGWLVTVASRRWIEQWRRDLSRRRREQRVAAMPAEDLTAVPQSDDTLRLLMLCCHPALTESSQVALTLRAVGGLTTPEIARAFLVPEATMGQRISRAKQRIKSTGARFELPPEAEHAGRIDSVLQVLYLVYNEGYTATSGDSLNRVDLTAEAIRLTRQVRELLPGEGEVAGLLALMLLTEARRPARTLPDGSLVPLAEQDRTRWDADAIAEGVALLDHALATTPVGPYQLQAAIAAVHDGAARAADTDWLQIRTLYDLLRVSAPGPMVTLNRLVAVAMVDGPRVALGELADAEREAAVADHHRVDAVRAHLLDLAGEHEAAREHYLAAARRTLSTPERRYLQRRASRTRSRPLD